MAPLELSSDLLATTLFPLLFGAGFGFFLERGGLTNTRRLVSQFFLDDMVVLKVMFTAVVTAMTLTCLASVFGMLDMNRVWVNPTFLGPVTLGGVLLGVGFMVGGYCPGTSLVAVATGKLDALAFVGGMLVGMFIFGETVPLYWDTWYTWGSYGRFTLPELFGISTGWTVVAAMVLALGFFAGGEWIEQLMGVAPKLTRGARRRLWMAAAGALAISLIVPIVGFPDTDDRVAQQQPALDEALASRDFHLDPAEVHDILTQDKLPIWLVDVRPDVDYNRFHINGSRRLPALEDLHQWVEDTLPDKTVIVLIGNGEAAANLAWKRLTAEGAQNVYVLEGGLNNWLDRYSHEGATHEGATHAPAVAQAGADSDVLNHPLPYAVGDRVPAAHPVPGGHHDGAEPSYTPKVKLKAAAGGGGGCG